MPDIEARFIMTPPPDFFITGTAYFTVRNMPFTRRAIIKADDIMGYGKQKSEWKWWLDVEEVEEELKEK